MLDQSALEIIGFAGQKQVIHRAETSRLTYGRKYMGVERTTVLIDRAGRVAHVWSKVKVPGHAEEVLEAARAL